MEKQVKSLSFDYLSYLCVKGWEKHIVPLNLSKEEQLVYANRLRYELDMIKKANLEDYFLIVWDILRFCDKQHILRGPGRGSVGGSLVAYLTGITKIDSVKYGCLFSRFFNIGRLQTGSLADIDMDIDNRYTDRVIKYIRQKYGHESVAGVSTVVKIYGKTAIKDVARSLALGFDGIGKANDRPETFKIASKITDEFPKAMNVPNISIDTALESSYELRLYEKKYQDVFDYGRRLEGLVRSNSVHPAGLIISSVPLIEHLPMKRAVGKNSDGDEILLDVADVDMKVLERRKFLKFDLLKLSTLSVIDDTLKLIEENRGERLSIDDIDLEDEETFRYLWRAKSLLGVFQFESTGMRHLIKKVKPKNIEELAHCNALYRPGPMDSGVLSEYVKRRQGLEPVTYDNPILEPILEQTQGLPIFQEQITQIAQAVAGFSEQTADILRAAIGKKNEQKMQSLKKYFIAGAIKNNYTEYSAERLFANIQKYGRYAFNKPHSIAYSILAYYTFWLKRNYRVEFITASINNEKHWDKIAMFIFDAKSHGIEVLPVDVSKSKLDFTVEGENKIRTGYRTVKGLGSIAPKLIVESAPYSDFLDFLDRTHYTGSKVSSAVVTAINACGGFESLGLNRHQAELFYEKALPVLRKKYPTKLERLVGYIGRQNLDGVNSKELALEIINGGFSEESLSLFDKRRINHIKKILGAEYKSRADALAELVIDDVEDWDIRKKCKEEKIFLGYFVSGHPTHEYLSMASDRIAYLSSMLDGDELDLVVFVDQLDKSKQVRGKKKMFKYLVSDESGTAELTYFAKQGTEPIITPGFVYHIKGKVNTFNGKNSILLWKSDPVAA